MDAFDVLTSVDTNGVEAMAHVAAPTAADAAATHSTPASARPSLELLEADVFRNAPARVEQSFSIPLVIE